jgi:hypothetical protein
MESLLGEEEVLSRQTAITGEKGHNFWSDRWIALKVLQVFPEAVFLLVRLESLLVEEEVLSRQTGITSKKAHNFRSDRCVELKLLQ